jgi:recombination protein RecA
VAKAKATKKAASEKKAKKPLTLPAIAKAIKGVTILGGKSFRAKRREGISSGSIALNRILTGDMDVGYVWGRVYEIYGPEGSGKTTLALHAVAEAHKLDVPCGYDDLEHSLDPVYAAAIGVGPLLLAQPDSGEQGLAAIKSMLENGVKLIVVDSVAALVPQAEIDGDFGDSHVGLHARLMSQALRKLTPLVAKHKAIVIFINQIRMKIGVLFGNPETTSGGKALRYYASVRMEVRAPRGGKTTLGKGDTKSLADDGVQETESGTHLVVKTVKNKLHPPFKKVALAILFGKGLDRRRDVLVAALSLGIISELTAKAFVYRGKKRSIKRMDDAAVAALEKRVRGIVDAEAVKEG